MYQMVHTKKKHVIYVLRINNVKKVGSSAVYEICLKQQMAPFNR